MEAELLKKEEKIIKIKEKYKNLKHLHHSQVKIQKEISEFRQQIHNVSLENSFKTASTNLSEKVIVYQKDDSTINDLMVLVEELKRSLSEKDVFIEKHKEELENTCKAKLIMQEEIFRINEKELIKQLDFLKNENKLASEKLILLEIRINELKHKKKTLKHHYKHENSELKKILETQENEFKGVLNRNSELEQKISEDQEEISYLSSEIHGWKQKYEELTRKMKAMKMKYKKICDGYTTDLIEMLNNCKKEQETTQTSHIIDNRVFREVYQIPNQQYHCSHYIPPQTQAIPIQTSGSCHCSHYMPTQTIQTGGFIQKEPAIIPSKNNDKCKVFEQMARKIKSSQKELFDYMEEGHFNEISLDFCFLLDKEFLLSAKFGDFLNIFKDKMKVLSGDINFSAIVLDKNEIDSKFLHLDFKRLQDFTVDKTPMNREIFSFEELNWRKASQKLISSFITKDKDLEQFLLVNKHFIMKNIVKCILINPSKELKRKLENNFYESSWEDLGNLPNLIEKILF